MQAILIVMNPNTAARRARGAGSPVVWGGSPPGSASAVGFAFLAASFWAASVGSAPSGGSRSGRRCAARCRRRVRPPRRHGGRRPEPGCAPGAPREVEHGRYAEAAAGLREAAADEVPAAPRTVYANLAEVLMADGRLADAEARYRDAVAVARQRAHRESAGRARRTWRSPTTGSPWRSIATGSRGRARDDRPRARAGSGRGGAQRRRRLPTGICSSSPTATSTTTWAWPPRSTVGRSTPRPPSASSSPDGPTAAGPPPAAAHLAPRARWQPGPPRRGPGRPDAGQGAGGRRRHRAGDGRHPGAPHRRRLARAGRPPRRLPRSRRAAAASVRIVGRADPRRARPRHRARPSRRRAARRRPSPAAPRPPSPRSCRWSTRRPEPGRDHSRPHRAAHRVPVASGRAGGV